METPPPPEGPASPTSDRGRLARLGLVLCLAAFLGQAGRFIGAVHDDAYITFRYAQRLAHGRGLTYNDGERVEGYTNFAWVMLLAGYFRVGGSAPLGAAKVLGVGCALLLLLLAYRLGRRVATEAGAARADLWGLVGPAVIATGGSFALQAMAGLETPLFLLCVLGALDSAADEAGKAGVWRTAGWLAGAALVRPDGLLLAAAITAVDLAGRDRGERLRAALLRLAALAVLLGPYAVWKLHYFGRLTPNTFAAKTAPLSAHWLQGHAWPGLAGALVGLFGLGALLLLAGAGSWPRRGPARRTLQLVVMAAAAYLAYAAWVGKDTLPGHRFYLTALVTVALLAAEGLRRAAARGRGAATLAVAGLLVTVVSTAYADLQLARATADFEDRLQRVFGEVARDATRRGARVVALRDIGLAGYRLPDARIVDLAGLTDTFVAHLPGCLDHKRVPVGYLRARGVDLLVAHGSSQPHIEGGRAQIDPNSLPPTVLGLLRDPEFASDFTYARTLVFSRELSLHLFQRR